MIKRTRFILAIIGLSLMTTLVHCDEEDIVCAGCPDDTPWSVPGSDDCYETFQDCDRSERGDCSICN